MIQKFETERIDPAPELQCGLEKLALPMKAEQGKASDLVSSNTFFDREVGWLRIDPRRSRWITLAVLCALVLYLAVIATLSRGPSMSSTTML